VVASEASDRHFFRRRTCLKTTVARTCFYANTGTATPGPPCCTPLPWRDWPWRKFAAGPSTAPSPGCACPKHIWHVDLTAVPIVGFWVPWLPFALLRAWPFCWWTAVAEDHFSRRAMGFRAF